MSSKGVHPEYESSTITVGTYIPTEKRLDVPDWLCGFKKTFFFLINEKKVFGVGGGEVPLHR